MFAQFVRQFVDSILLGLDALGLGAGTSGRDVPDPRPGRVASALRVPRPVGINHVAVEVADLDEALDFFERLFGTVDLRGRHRGMAFVDLGDQFIALAETAGGPAPGAARHVGLVVDDRAATLAAARAAGVRFAGDNDLVDPSGNVWQVVDYRDVQFTKAPTVLAGMGLDRLEKSESALAELRQKRLA
jgi:catechol 2,3-dioxygenase-like lactoylglutathione lyase family enzyme